MVFDAQGKDLQAIENYEKATQLKPDYADAFNNIGIILYSLGRPEEAVSRLKRRFAQTLTSWTLATILGSCCKIWVSMKKPWNIRLKRSSLNPPARQLISTMQNPCGRKES